MEEKLSKEATYSFNDEFGDIGIVELRPEEKSCMKKVAEIMFQCKQDLMTTWSDIFFKRFRAQKSISGKNWLQDPENLVMQIHMSSLVNDFMEYVNKGDIDGYIKSNVLLGKKMAKEDLSF